MGNLQHLQKEQKRNRNLLKPDQKASKLSNKRPSNQPTNQPTNKR